MKPFLSVISVCLSLSAIILAVSCVKSTPATGGGSGSGSSNPSNNSYLSSIRNNTPLAQVVDSFTYDNSNRLTKITIAANSSNSHLSGESTVTFSYSGSSTTPGSYIINNPNQNSSSHQLYYDGQDRINKDSALDGTGLVTYWSYSSGNIVSTTISGSSEQMIDTLFFTNGNLTANHSYIANNTGTVDTLLSSTQYTYNSIVNPCYHQAIASTIGPLLNNLVIDGGFTDFVSGYAKSSVTNNPLPGLHGLPVAQSTQTLTWTTDSKDRAATLKVTDPQIGLVGNLIFSYY
jgi:hypothetical protein